MANPLSPSDKIFRILVLAIPFTIAFPIRLNSLIVLLAVAAYIFCLIQGKVEFKKAVREPVFVLCGIQLLVIFAGLLRTENMSQGWSIVERMAFIAVFPLLVAHARTIGMKTNDMLSSFSVGVISITIIAFIINIINGISLGKGHSAYTDAVLIHPTYLSLYLTISFFYVLDIVQHGRRVILPRILTLLLAVLAYTGFMILFLRSQMGLAVFIIVALFYVVIQLKARARIVAAILFVFAFLAFLLDPHRVTTVLDTYGENVSTAVDQRFSVWSGTLAGIATAPVFGAGTGDAQQLINEGYKVTGYTEGIDLSFNAHNQYLQFLAQNGIVELLCFIALFFYAFGRSVKTTPGIFLLFNLAVTLIMVVESFLTVQKGIVFYYFFVSVFLLLPSDPPKTERTGAIGV